MSRFLNLFLSIGVFCSLVFAASEAPAARKVMVVGDSWAYGFYPNLDSQFATYGHGDWDVYADVQNPWGVMVPVAIPGATAENFGSNAGGVMDLVKRGLQIYPETEVVVISLGGNDFWPNYMSQGAGIFVAIENNLRVVVDEILATRDVDILFTGYDVLKFDKSDFCLLFALNYFGVVFPWEVTPLFMEIGAAQQRIANDYPEVTCLNLFGTGQGRPGSPDLTKWSPATYVASSTDDCLHLSETGENKFTKEIYCQYFAPRFSETCKPAPVCGAAPGVSASMPGADLSAILCGFVFFLLVPAGTVIGWKRHRRRACGGRSVSP